MNGGKLKALNVGRWQRKRYQKCSRGLFYASGRVDGINNLLDLFYIEDCILGLRNS